MGAGMTMGSGYRSGFWIGGHAAIAHAGSRTTIVEKRGVCGSWYTPHPRRGTSPRATFTAVVRRPVFQLTYCRAAHHGLKNYGAWGAARLSSPSGFPGAPYRGTGRAFDRWKDEFGGNDHGISRMTREPLPERYPGSESGTCFRSNRSCQLAPAHRGRPVLCLVKGTVDTARPPRPSGGQAPALHFLVPPSSIGLRVGRIIVDALPPAHLRCELGELESAGGLDFAAFDLPNLDRGGDIAVFVEVHRAGSALVVYILALRQESQCSRDAL